MTNKNTLVKKGNTFSNYITSAGVKQKINEMVGGRDGQRFITAIISAVSTNPALSECDQGTILSAALLGESLKLSPSPQLGQYYMVPFNDRKRNRKVAQFLIGYKGYIQLAVRSGFYKKINVLSIKEGELIRYDPLEEEIEVDLIDDEEQRDATETIGYYAMFEYTNGFKKSLYWSKKKMEIHADKYSKAFSIDAFHKIKNGEIANSDMWRYSSFWYKDFDGMAYKTMLRQLISKWGIMSIEMETAQIKDMASITEDGGVNYVDNIDEPDRSGTETKADPLDQVKVAPDTPKQVGQDEFFGDDF